MVRSQLAVETARRTTVRGGGGNRHECECLQTEASQLCAPRSELMLHTFKYICPSRTIHVNAVDAARTVPQKGGKAVRELHAMEPEAALLNGRGGNVSIQNFKRKQVY